MKRAVVVLLLLIANALLSSNRSISSERPTETTLRDPAVDSESADRARARAKLDVGIVRLFDPITYDARACESPLLAVQYDH
jgi:hypothetical protein